VDVHTKLDELTELVTEARSMPMSASCILNRGEVLTLLDELRELLPEELHHAETVLEEREAVVSEGRREAERLVEDARAEQARLVGEQEVVQEAHAYAAQVVERARAEAERIRLETDEYVDGKLADFEVVLGKTLTAVTRGRERLARRAEPEAAHSGDSSRPDSRGTSEFEELPVGAETARP
jgi:cell division septum initiation protein DivIVA